jgi:hypothetical protein
MVAAAVYDEQQLADLGKRFLVCTQEAVSKIRINPQLYPVVDPDVRGCLTRTFPFALLYRDQGLQRAIKKAAWRGRELRLWETTTEIPRQARNDMEEAGAIMLTGSAKFSIT